MKGAQEDEERYVEDVLAAEVVNGVGFAIGSEAANEVGVGPDVAANAADAEAPEHVVEAA